MTTQTGGGLSSAEAAARLARYGANIVPGPRRPGVLARVAQQLRDPLIVVLLIAAALTIVTGDYSDTVIIAVVIVVNTTVGVGQELRADKAIDALSAMAAPVARVRRDDAIAVVAATDVVSGDVMLLGEGDIVPADARLVEATALTIDESALTGESVAVTKEGANAQRPADMVYAGTVVVRGRAEAEVTATGADSATGRIAALMSVAPTLTPLQRRLVGLGRVLAAVGALLCLVVLAIGLANGRSVELMVVTAISLLVAAVPESLPAVVTLALALGARRMAARHAIARRLPAVETLGAVSVLATDKTGTLTQGRMVVESVWTPHGEATVTGRGYAPTGIVSSAAGPVQACDAPHLTALFEAAALCNDATIRRPAGPDDHGQDDHRQDDHGQDDHRQDDDGQRDWQDEDWQPVGDPMEAALVVAAARFGIAKHRLDQRLPRIAEVPFDSARQRMTTVHRRPDSRLLIACKGAPEVLLTRVEASPAVAAACRSQAESYARRGYRVLALATAVRDAIPAPGDLAPDELAPDELESGLTLLGLVALADPPRPEAAAAVAQCRAAGIRPVLVSGDHVATAEAIARRVGLLNDGDAIASGDELAAGKVDDVTTVRVLARTKPEQKVTVIEAWQRAGHVVAMTGDGVNDGPALRRADIGVAMGGRGTEVARQAADLVLADDHLGTVVAAVEEGRRIYDNVRRFLLYALAGGTAEILIMLVGPGFGLALPLLPAQILWVNLVTHGIPGVALGAEPAEPDVLGRPPRPANQQVLGDGLTGRILLLGLAVTLLSLGVGLGARTFDRPWQTMLFLALASTQLAVAVGVRARVAGWRHHVFLFSAVVGALVVQLGGVYLPLLQNLLGTQALNAWELLGTMAVSGIGWLAARATIRRGGQP